MTSVTRKDDTGVTSKNMGVDGNGRKGAPAIITNDNTGVPTLVENSEPHPEIPLWIQPSHCHKDFVMYFAPDSQSSGDKVPP